VGTTVEELPFLGKGTTDPSILRLNPTTTPLHPIEKIINK
jgi:hypothetical protein